MTFSVGQTTSASLTISNEHASPVPLRTGRVPFNASGSPKALTSLPRQEKTELALSVNSALAIPTGVEPATFSSAGRRSIH